jgi:hypothetical protein
MKRFASLGLVLGAGVLFVAGCGGGSGSSTQTAQLRIVNADAYAVFPYDVLLAGATFTTGLNIGTSTAYTAVASGTDLIEVRNAGNANDVFSQSLTLTAANNYSFVTMGTLGQSTGVLFTDNNTAVASGNTSIRVINACDAAGVLDVYITPSTPPVDLFTVPATVSGLQFGSGTGYKSMAAGSWEIRLTPHGNPAFNYLDVSSTFAAGSVVTIVARDAAPSSTPCNSELLPDATS